MDCTVVVESPVKAFVLRKEAEEGNLPFGSLKTIATKGHFLTLKNVSIRKDGSYTCSWQPAGGHGESVVKEIEKAARSGSPVFVLTDPDREGELIAKHVQNVCGKEVVRVRTTSFTTHALKKAFSEPDKVNERTARTAEVRHIVDRSIGFTVSAKAGEHFSGNRNDYSWALGRVQGGGLGILAGYSGSPSLAGVRYTNGMAGVVSLSNRRCLNRQGDAHRVLEARRRKSVLPSPAPLHTASMLIAAGSTFGWSPAKTMSHANRLYSAGYITYPRTDSAAVSDRGMEVAFDYVTRNFSHSLFFERDPDSYRGVRKEYTSGAHECIRPTLPLGCRELLDDPLLDTDDVMLFRLISAVFYASQMPPAVADEIEAKVAGPGISEGTASGFLSSHLSGHQLAFADMEIADCFNPLMSSFSSSLIVKNWEGIINSGGTVKEAPCDESCFLMDMYSLCIGRPSTYAPTLSKLYRKEYVRKKKGLLSFTDKGASLFSWARESFPFVIDPSFSRWVEGELEKLEQEETREREKRLLSRIVRLVDGEDEFFSLSVPEGNGLSSEFLPDMSPAVA